MSEYEDTQLPALIDRATRRLSEARSSAEVLEAKAIAEAALHYATLTKAANETHADCLRMIVRAEMRMATEIDRGQERGEIARPTENQSNLARDSGRVAATLDDLGVSSQRLSEWRETRDAGPEVVEAAISEALVEGRPPTKSDVRRAVRTAVKAQGEQQSPKASPATKTHPKHAQIAERLKAGDTAKQIKTVLNVDSRVVRAVRVAEGLGFWDTSRDAVNERTEQVRQMAADGYTSSQIAGALGLSNSRVSHLAKRNGITIHANSVMGKVKFHDAIRIVEHIVMDAEHLTADVDRIEFASLDSAMVGVWVESLQASRKKLSAFIARLQKETHREAATA